ncbi:hypothetical protein [Siphonobacter aquaeclarae]|uniref:Lipoprotein n=1 Tax=Siphonobacter aquaeclarae TaxID=563176 RepID=A0A1G9X6M3_9BACT|nr:hypothetical protein [Siphonobacter aquaeclarae]SDM91993.1 hypothetical protein SAMN04488090_4563 [Siphonobacter aquaeclarae]
MLSFFRVAKSCFALSISFLLFSCGHEILQPVVSQEDLTISGDRIAFSSRDQYRQTLEKLSTKEGYKEITSRLENKGFRSLKSYFRENNSDTLHFPSEIYEILNENLEYSISDTIYRYDVSRKVKYAFSKNETDAYTKAKNGLNPGDRYIFSRFNSTPVEMRSTGGRVSISEKGIDARHQKEFMIHQYNMGSASGRRKYVHELWAYYEASGLQMSSQAIVESYLFLQIKLEKKANTGWNNATEARYVWCNIYGDSEVITKSNPNTWDPATNKTTFRFSEMFPTVGTVKLTLHKFTYMWWWEVGAETIKHQFSVEVNGSITQEIVGGIPMDSWTNEGYPLW